jgi:hypothetical protein
MDWIERLFGISPDGGNGLAEALVISSIVVLVVLVYLRRVWNRRE